MKRTSINKDFEHLVRFYVIVLKSIAFSGGSEAKGATMRRRAWNIYLRDSTTTTTMTMTAIKKEPSQPYANL